MRAPTWFVSALQAGCLVIYLTACSLVAAPGSEQSSGAQASETPSLQIENTPLFAPQSAEVIEPSNASALAPSSAVNFQGMSDLVWLPDGQEVAMAGEQVVVVLSTTESALGPQAGSPETTQTFTTTTPSLLYAAPEEAVLAWVSGGEAVNVLDTTGETGNLSVTHSVSPVTGLTLTPSGDVLAYATLSRQVVTQKPGYAQNAQSWATPAWLSNLSYSPDTTQLAGADPANFTLYFLDAKTGEVLRSLEWLGSATSALYGVYLSPDWSQAAWVAKGAVQLMDADDGRIGPTLSHENVVNAIAWSADSRLLATAAAATVNGILEPAVLIWDANNGTLLNTLVQPAPVQSLAFSPDGRQLAVLNTNGSLRTWSISR